MKRLALVVLMVAAVLTPSVVVAQKTTSAVPVFVTSVGAHDGFTDPNKDNQDTLKDLRDAIKGHKTLALADTREAAVIVLVVMNREKAQLTAGVVGGSARDCTVRVTFIYKDSETEMSASAQGGTLTSGGAWSKAAGKVAKQIDEWVTANRAKLTDVR